jgi:UDP-N-acetylglucosamine 2-epimerase (non-hydrolysing)
MRILAVYGTRPEAIKVLPIVKMARKHSEIDLIPIFTGQHRDLVEDIETIFEVRHEYNLNIFKSGQSLDEIFSKCLLHFGQYLDSNQVDAVLVQGDTSSAFACALASFHRTIPVIHVEAGLRTNTIFAPFPEEANRRLISKITSLHLPATKSAKTNLVSESVAQTDIFVTGNTVIDALEIIMGKIGTRELSEGLRGIAEPFCIVTAHRRESWGVGMENIARAIKQVSIQFPQLTFVVATHPNPNVASIFDRELKGIPNVLLTGPINYSDLINLLSRAKLVLTDSGGIQEEAPYFKVPLLVLRDETERMEGIEAGFSELVGTDIQKIVSAAESHLSTSNVSNILMTKGNPYGDGLASQRVLYAIEKFFALDYVSETEIKEF